MTPETPVIKVTFPRRMYLEKMTAEERAIYDVFVAVNNLAATSAAGKLEVDPRLAEACSLLSKARDLVADYVDGIDRAVDTGTVLEKKLWQSQ